MKSKHTLLHVCVGGMKDKKRKSNKHAGKEQLESGGEGR